MFQKFVQAREKSTVKRCHSIHTKTDRTEVRKKLQSSRNTGGLPVLSLVRFCNRIREHAAPSLEEEELLGPTLNEHLVHSKGHDDNTDNFSRENCARCGRKVPESDVDTGDWAEHMLNWVECTFFTRWEHFACADYWPKGDNADQWPCAKCLNV